MPKAKIPDPPDTLAAWLAYNDGLRKMELGRIHRRSRDLMLLAGGAAIGPLPGRQRDALTVAHQAAAELVAARFDPQRCVVVRQLPSEHM